ncbi:MAG TPA: hypothetical protein VME46_18320 [Acidimicrobiales bacterium]|nr:hypothetical protein [Acidimicrobiales bacterium]
MADTISAREVPTAERRGFKSYRYLAVGTALLGAGLWAAGPLRAAASHTVPLAFSSAALGFVVLQWLVDRRDPKFVDAPTRKNDDSIGFE